MSADPRPSAARARAQAERIAADLQAAGLT